MSFPDKVVLAALKLIALGGGGLLPHRTELVDPRCATRVFRKGKFGWETKRLTVPPFGLLVIW